MPWSHAALAVGDRVRLPKLTGNSLHDNRDYTIISLEDGAARRVKAVALAPVIRRPDRSRLPALADTDTGNIEGQPLFHLLDLPMWPGVENEQNQFKIACYSKPWRQVALYTSPQDSDYQLRSRITSAAIIGELQTVLAPAPSGRFLHRQSFDVKLYRGELRTQTIVQLLNAANSAAVQTATGSWEILQFTHAEEIAPDLWRLQGLLRGQCGTEPEARLAKLIGAAFIMLDEGVVPAGLHQSESGLTLNWRAGAAGKDFSDEYYATQQAIGGVVALRPLQPVHLRYKRRLNGDIHLSWIRRGRIDADSWMGEEIPLGEAIEKYQVALWRDAALLHSHEVTEPFFNYTQALLQQDSVPGSGALRFEVSQISQAYGAGVPAILLMVP